MSKPWPKKLSKKDPDPSDYDDLSVETQRLVVHGDHVYFFLWCWDLEQAENQTSVLFRVHRSFDQPGERLAAVKTEMVDLCVHDGMLVALENGQDNRGGFGVVHRLEPGASVPVSSTRFDEGKLWKAIAVGPKNTLHAAGDVVQRFDGKTWHVTKLPEKACVKAIASNGSVAFGVGAQELIVALEPEGEPRIITFSAEEHGAHDYEGVDVTDDGVLSLAARNSAELRQGRLGTLEKLEAPPNAVFNDSCLFRGRRYWSAAGDVGTGGLYVQDGKKLVLVFEHQSCFKLTPTDEHLFIASEAGILRHDGNDEWKPVSTSYDEDEEVWVMVPGEPEEADEEDDDDESDDDDE